QSAASRTRSSRGTQRRRRARQAVRSRAPRRPGPRRAGVDRVSDDTMRAAIAAVWERSRDTILARVEVLESAARAALAGTLSEDNRRGAEREAHKLAGAVGSFGFWDA